MRELPADRKLTPTRQVVRSVKSYYVKFEEEGWATMTICNDTGVVNVCSDWLDGSYRWHINALGGLTMEQFIGKFSKEHGSFPCDYLARKLFGDTTKAGHVFYDEETHEAFHKAIREARRNHPKEITAELAKQMHEAVKEVDEYNLPNILYKLDMPSEKFRYGPSGQWLMMRAHVLPALVAMVQAEVDHASAPDLLVPAVAGVQPQGGVS